MTAKPHYTYKWMTSEEFVDAYYPESKIGIELAYTYVRLLEDGSLSSAPHRILVYRDVRRPPDVWFAELTSEHFEYSWNPIPELAGKSHEEQMELSVVLLRLGGVELRKKETE